jgi:hypothetical protein
MMFGLILGVTWLLLSAALAHHKMTHPNKHIDDFRRAAEILPHWLVAVLIAVVLPLAPVLALLGWLESLRKRA